MNPRNRKISAKSATALGLSLTALVALSVSQGSAKEAAHSATPPSKTVQQPAPEPVRPKPAIAAPLTSAESILDSRIRDIGRRFNGDIGIAVKDIQTGYTTAYDGHTYFPQQSVSKFWVALTALDRADRGHLNLESSVTVRKEDLTLFHQPIAALVGASGYTTTLNSLMHRAITQSDNTANDFVLWKAGGPDAVRSYLADKRISGIRFGPGERMLQARIAGMEWRDSMVGSNFYSARNALPMSVRRAAFERYIEDPMDGATPVGIVEALARLKQGDLLSPRSTERLLSIMSQTRTGARRLKGGLRPGWTAAHKTGTGQVLGSEQAGYNDIGIITGPDGRSYAIAVMIRRTSAPLAQRMEAMQEVVRATIDYSAMVPPERFAGKAQPPRATQQAAQLPAAGFQTVAATVQSLPEDDAN